MKGFGQEFTRARNLSCTGCRDLCWKLCVIEIDGGPGCDGPCSAGRELIEGGPGCSGPCSAGRVEVKAGRVVVDRLAGRVDD